MYNVVERANAEAEVTVQLQQGNLTADIQVTVQTVDGGTATGMKFKAKCDYCILYVIPQPRIFFTSSGC